MKKRIISLLLAMVMCVMPVCVFAVEGNTVVLPSVKPEMPSSEQTTTLITKVNGVLGILQVIGFVVAIVMVMYVGIKYLTAGAGTKADVKTNLVPMLIGAALIGLAPTLVNWIWGIFAK